MRTNKKMNLSKEEKEKEVAFFESFHDPKKNEFITRLAIQQVFFLSPMCCDTPKTVPKDRKGMAYLNRCSKSYLREQR